MIKSDNKCKSQIKVLDFKILIPEYLISYGEILHNKKYKLNYITLYIYITILYYYIKYKQWL